MFVVGDVCLVLSFVFRLVFVAGDVCLVLSPVLHVAVDECLNSMLNHNAKKCVVETRTGEQIYYILRTNLEHPYLDETKKC